jgi:hypothetical protein
MSITPSGFRTKVAGRTVIVRTGRKSQTVNICTPRQVVGDYEVIYRLPIQSAVEDPGEIPEVATVAEFETWLTERNGERERPTAHGKLGDLSPLVRAPVNDAWVSDAVPLVEEAIGSLVNTFVRAPYLHRVEHSFHAELISELRKHDKLRVCVKIGASGRMTQLIHKEWPETIVRVDRGKTVERRGLFDIAMLAPVQFEKVTLEQFRQGRIEPPIVIKVGLDYGLKHIDGDIDKLRTSEVPHPYLIHLSRIGSRVEAVENRINEIATSAPGLQVAYVHHGVGSVAVKRLNDSAVSTQSASPAQVHNAG